MALGCPHAGGSPLFIYCYKENSVLKRKVTIAGPMCLMNQFTDANAEDATKGSRTSSATKSKGTPREQAEKCVYKSSDGKKIIFPSINMFACICEAGKFFKSGRNKITTQKTSMLTYCLTVTGENNPMELNIITKEPWTVDSRRIVNPSTRGSMLKHRPLFIDWTLTFFLEIDTEDINEALVREIVDAAGRKIGLGDYRIACKGQFGRFTVTKWETVKA